MKTTVIFRQSFHQAFATGALLFSLALSCAVVQAAESPPAAKPAEEKKVAEESSEELNNWLEFGAGNYFVNGDKGMLRHLQQGPSGFFYGLQDLHIEKPVDNKGLFQLDGRAIPDIHDYLLKLDLRHPDRGYLNMGYRSFRVWYDDSGGFSSASNKWVNSNQEFFVDRTEGWIEAGLTLPEWPVFKIRYDYQARDGTKDSTMWGDYNLSIGTAAAANTRGIIPAFRVFNEHRQTVTGDMKHTLGNTDFGLGLRYEKLDNNDALVIRRRAGEVPPVTAAPGLDRYATQKDVVHSDFYNFHAFTETRFTEELMLTTGYSYTRLETGVSGSRIYGADYDAVYDPTFARRQARDEGFFDLSGGTTVDQHVVNVSVMATPWEHVTIVPAIRIENQVQDGAVQFMDTAVGSAPALTTTATPMLNTRAYNFLDVSESLEARYTGLKNWSFYARGEWLEGDSSLRESETTAGVLTLQRDTESSRLTQKYTVGANWYPLAKLNFAGQYYYKVRENEYNSPVDPQVIKLTPPVNTGDFYPAFIRALDFATHDVNFRATWRPLNTLTLVGRYDFQFSTVNMRGDYFTNGTPLASVESSKTVSHIISGNASWTPLARLFVQAGASYVLDRTDTPANDITTGTAAGLVQASRNNYWNGNFMIGVALDNKSDLQASYYYYRADNYSDNSAISQPYGAGAEEHAITATLTRQLTKRLTWKLRYGYFSNRDQTSGGYNDYEAHLVYSGFQYRF